MFKKIFQVENLSPQSAGKKIYISKSAEYTWSTNGWVSSEELGLVRGKVVPEQKHTYTEEKSSEEKEKAQAPEKSQYLVRTCSSLVNVYSQNSVAVWFDSEFI